LGKSDPWELPEFLAFQKGFNIDLGNNRLVQVLSTPPAVIESWLTIFQTFKLRQNPDFCRKLLAATSNRRVTDVSQVVTQLKFDTLDRIETELITLLHQSFQLRLIRWLNGKGHPIQLRGELMPVDIYDCQKDDPLARAKLLLLAITETELIPLGDLALTVRVHSDMTAYVN
jgi:hypothetical protein